MRSGFPAGSLLAGLAAVLTVQVGCDGGSEGGDTSTAGVGSGGSGPEEPECLLPVDPGPCQESIQRYYYEPSAETCQQFTLHSATRRAGFSDF
jgi:hypothetical protein